MNSDASDKVVSDIELSGVAAPVQTAGERSVERPSTRRHHRHSRVGRIRRRLGKILRFKTILVVLLIAIMIPAALAETLIADANARVQESWNDLRRTVDSFGNRSVAQFTQSDIDNLQGAIGALTANLETAQHQVGFLNLVSSLNSRISIQLQVLDLAHEMSEGVQDTLAGARPAIDVLFPDTSHNISATPQPNYSGGDQVAQLLQVGNIRFTSAEQHYALVQSKLQSINYAALSPDLLSDVQAISRYYDNFRKINQILLNGPEIVSQALGLQDGKNYLILSQNSDELRPSGGYISTFGYVRIHQGQIIDYGYNPTTATSPNPPPASLASEIKVPDWWIPAKNPVYMAWDGSWYADFPTTAQMAAWFYEKGDNPRTPVDGVIGIDITAFQYLLGAIGPVKVTAYNNEQVTADNFRQVIYRIREGPGDLPHKQFLAALYKQIFADWQAATQQHSNDFTLALLRALQEKHIMLYFRDDKLNQMAGSLGWSGSQPPATGHDYVMVADANLGSKSNSSILRQLAYNVDIQPDGSSKSQLAVTYNYSGQIAATDPGVNPRNYSDINYYNIMQVFVPVGATITDSQNLQSKINTVNDSKYTDFVTLTQINFNSSQRYQLSYTTPVLTEQLGPYHRYRLLIQKQSGMAQEPTTVQITLPAGAQVMSTSPEPEKSYTFERQLLTFTVPLITDQWIEIVYSQ